MKPKQRSALRLAAGTIFYRGKRYLQWWLTKKRFAKTRDAQPFPHLVAAHQSPLLRKLKDVEMWLQQNKVTNLRIAIGQLNGIVIQPGETFSYWRLIGKPTRRKGYVDGMILSHGKVTAGVGGGLCQLSNLIYWMTLHTPLTVTERHRHSYDVFPDADRQQPFGSGATCYYNYLDLQIENRTHQPYQLRLYLSDSHLHGEWRTLEPPLTTYEVYEREHWIKPAVWGGYSRHNILYRRVFNAQGELIADEYVTENHAMMMYEPYLPAGNRRGE